MENDASDPHTDRAPGLEPLLCFDVYAAHQAFGRLYKSHLAPLGLTYSRYLVLLLLDPDRPMTVGEIGRALGLESNTLTPLLKRMQQDGLVTRQRDAEDERRVVVALTRAGSALQAKAREVPRCIVEDLGIPVEQIRALQSGLRDLTGQLDRAAGAGTTG